MALKKTAKPSAPFTQGQPGRRRPRTVGGTAQPAPTLPKQVNGGKSPKTTKPGK